MGAFKQQCIELRKQDRSLLEIAKITGRPKTSVYFHIRQFPLSIGKQRAIRKSHGEWIRLFALKRKGKSVRKFRIFNKWGAEKVLLIAHLLFDGEIKSRGCIYNNRNNALLQRVERCMKRIYSFPPSRYNNSFTGVSKICYFNVALGAYIGQKSKQLLDEIEQLPKALRREFVRAFFDDEGCMDFRLIRNSRRIRGYQKNVEILKLISKLLLSFGVQSRVQKPNEIVITGRENLIAFQKEINFSPGVKINGNRSNSIWNKHLEKRGILQKAIASYEANEPR